MRTKKRSPKPTDRQMAALGMIARSPLMKTYTNGAVSWSLQNGTPMNSDTVAALIRNGWVKPVRDGLGLLDESQIYVARKPPVTPLTKAEVSADP
jgi:hypothetical protein